MPSENAAFLKTLPLGRVIEEGMEEKDVPDADFFDDFFSFVSDAIEPFLNTPVLGWYVRLSSEAWWVNFEPASGNKQFQEIRKMCFILKTIEAPVHASNSRLKNVKSMYGDWIKPYLNKSVRA